MKRPITIILLILNFLTIWGQKSIKIDTLNLPSPPNLDGLIAQDGEEFIRIYIDSKITLLKTDIGGYVNIDKGDNVVFHYYHRDTDWDFIVDENYEEEAYFEFNPRLLNQSISGDSLSLSKAFYSWKCFCDWPDSNQVEIRNGYIKLTSINDSYWKINLLFVSELKHDTLKIDTTLSYFKGGYSLVNSDTLNRLDCRGKRYGYWETETKYRRKYGYYNDDEKFTGTELVYFYKNESKLLSEITIIDLNIEIEKIRFNEIGKIIKHCILANKKEWICDDDK